MMGFRVNSYIDVSIGEQEQDANSALTELDKGLRSGKVGEQCEAIVRFPRLFEKYPFPILINSSFLKLADIFRMGNNFLSLWVLRVCQQSEKHLDKILNVDEFLRRVYSVLHSNDPVARALALKTLGAVAGIIPERQNVHHAIRRGLDSHDDVEVDAAIYATTRFAAHSNTFAVAMCNKLSDMIECENTSTDRRDKLVRALRTVHGGAVKAQGVLKLLNSLMEKFPSSSSVRAAISAITAIADDTVVHVPDQVEVLLNIAMNDARASVRRAALLGLKKLAEHAALWPATCVERLVVAASARSDDPAYTLLCLQVMKILAGCPAVLSCSGGAAGDALGGCMSRAALSADAALAATAATVYTRLLLHCYEENLPVEGSDLMLALESLVISTGHHGTKDNTKPLKVALSCLVKLSTAQPLLYAPRTAKLLGAQLDLCHWISDTTTPQQKSRLELILEALCALGGCPASPAAVQPAMAAVVSKLKMVAALDGHDPSSGTALVLLCTVCCQERAGAALQSSLSNDWIDLLQDAIKNADGWTQYRVARAALRYAHPSASLPVVRRLRAGAPSESLHRWTDAIARAAAADVMLAKEGPSALDAASAQWQRAGEAAAGACAGCGGCGVCAGTCSAWLRARSVSLNALSRAAGAARALCTQPPPATAHHHHQSSREPSTKSGACCIALKKASKAALNAAKAYADIAKEAFHADDATLRHLQISQHTYNLLAQFLERITTSNQQERQIEVISNDLKPMNLEEKIMLSVCDKLEDISRKLFDDPTTKPGITHRHSAAVVCAAGVLCAGVPWWGGALCVRAGGARVRLSLSAADSVPLHTHLALKADGVLLPPHCARKKKNERQVKSVQLTVTATPHPRNNEKTVELSSIPPVLTAVQTVAPVRDFFSAQQLIALPAAGVYSVGVDAAVIDQHGGLWMSGPRTTIVVKAEDPNSKGNVQTTRGRF